SQHEIAEMCGMSQSWVSEILRQADLKPHKMDYWCGRSPDPEFESKMVDIVGLYLTPPLRMLWFYQVMRKHRSKPWIASSRNCRCVKAIGEDSPTPTSVMAR